MCFFFRGFFFLFQRFVSFLKKQNFIRFFVFLEFLFCRVFDQRFFFFFLSFFFLDGFLFFRVCFLVRKDLLRKKPKLQTKEGEGPLSPQKRVFLTKDF